MPKGLLFHAGRHTQRTVTTDSQHTGTELIGGKKSSCNVRYSALTLGPRSSIARQMCLRVLDHAAIDACWCTEVRELFDTDGSRRAEPVRDRSMQVARKRRLSRGAFHGVARIMIDAGFPPSAHRLGRERIEIEIARNQQSIRPHCVHEELPECVADAQPASGFVSRGILGTFELERDQTGAIKFAKIAREDFRRQCRIDAEAARA